MLISEPLIRIINKPYSIETDSYLDDLYKDISKKRSDHTLLISNLEKLYYKEFRIAKNTKLIDNISEFNSILELIAIESEQYSLQLYSTNLSKLIELFNIEGIEMYFVQFESVMKKLINLD